MLIHDALVERHKMFSIIQEQYMLIHDALVERHKMFFYYSGTVHVNT